MSVHGRSQHMSSRTRSEGSPEMFFPTGKLIGSSRLLRCWLEARWEEGIPKPAQGYQCGGKVSSPICQMEHVKGQPAERGRQRAWKAKHSQECPVSPRKKKTTTKNQMKLQTVCNGITLICRGRAGGAALTVIYWVVSTNIWEWLEPKCQLLNSGAEHEAGSGPGLAELRWDFHGLTWSWDCCHSYGAEHCSVQRWGLQTMRSTWRIM